MAAVERTDLDFGVIVLLLVGEGADALLLQALLLSVGCDDEDAPAGLGSLPWSCHLYKPDGTPPECWARLNVADLAWFEGSSRWWCSSGGALHHSSGVLDQFSSCVLVFG